jgi:hypothetical protein
MILRAAKKLIGIARIVEKIVAINPMAMVWIIDPATNVLIWFSKPQANQPFGDRQQAHITEDLQKVVAYPDGSVNWTPCQLVTNVDVHAVPSADFILAIDVHCDDIWID